MSVIVNVASLSYLGDAVGDSGMAEEFGQYTVSLEFVRRLNPADASC